MSALKTEVDTPILLAIGLALQLILNGYADACTASILAILSASAIETRSEIRLGFSINCD